MGSLPPLALAGLFFGIAILYTSAGFGGGSSYIALLILAGVSPQWVPLMALPANIAASGVGLWRAIQAKSLNLTRCGPLVAIALPFSFLGGLTPVSPEWLTVIMGGLLLGSAVLLGRDWVWNSRRSISTFWLFFVSIVVAYLAGVVGIGGGIFLAPILHLIRWGNGREIAAFSTLFICLSSGAGLAGQLLKIRGTIPAELPLDILPLILAVAVGAFLGSALLQGPLKSHQIRRLVAALVGVAAIRLLLM